MRGIVATGSDGPGFLFIKRFPDPFSRDERWTDVFASSGTLAMFDVAPSTKTCIARCCVSTKVLFAGRRNRPCAFLRKNPIHPNKTTGGSTPDQESDEVKTSLDKRYRDREQAYCD